MAKQLNRSPEAAEKEKRRKEIVEVYASLVSEGIIFPRRSDLKDRGVTKDSVGHHFGNIKTLRKAAKELHPEAFSGSISIDDYVSNQYLSKIKKDVKKFKRFVITTAVSGQPLDTNFYASIKNYCKAKNAKLLILPSHDPAHNLDNEIEWHFDSSIIDETFVFEEIPINLNLFISEIRVTAKQINPVTGLSEISQNKGSFIFASPKQSLEFDTVSANKLPHARMSTGACTLPNYKTTRGTSLRTGYLATFQHVMGAVIVEVKDNEMYHFRQIQADANGHFCELGKEYGPNSIKKVKPILVMGDYHAGEQDDPTVEAWINAINEMEIEEVVFHDMFNGVSVNPHEEEDMMLRAERAEKGLNILKNELKITSVEFDRILSQKTVKRGVVVKSNHDDMIDRYINKAKFAKDPSNFRFGCQLAAVVGGTEKDYFKEGMDLAGCRPVHHRKLRWLTVDEDYVVGGVHLGAHGDKGANGSKGSLKSLSKSYPKCVVGHSHTPGIFKGAFQVGTTSLLRLGYNRGPSSWIHCSCLVYPNGQRQLINSINGIYRLP